VEARLVKKTIRYWGYNKKETPFWLLTYRGAPRGPTGAGWAGPGGGASRPIHVAARQNRVWNGCEGQEYVCTDIAARSQLIKYNMKE